MSDDLIIPIDAKSARIFEFICDMLAERFGIGLPLSVIPKDDGIQITVPGGHVLVASTVLRELHTSDGLLAYLNAIKVQN